MVDPSLSSLGAFGTGVAVAVITGWFTLRNTNKTAGVSQFASLLDGQQKLIGTLSENTTSYQDLLKKYADALTEGAHNAALLETMSGEMHDLKTKFDTLQESFNELKSQYVGAKEMASRIPGLEQEVLELKLTLLGKDEMIEKINAQADVALRAQGMAEGALAEKTGQKPPV